MPDSIFTASEQRTYTAEFAARVTGNYVDGGWMTADSTETIEVFDPSTGKRIGEVVASSEKDVDVAVTAAHAARRVWAQTPPSARSKALLDLAALVEAHAEEMIALECVDAGKPVTAVRDDEFPGVLDAMRYFAGAGRTLSAQAGGDYLEGITSIMRREPLGVVVGITPWNYPLLQAVAKIFPALATGNTVVIKPAETTPYSTAYLVELAGAILPPGVLNVVFGTGPVAGNALSRHPETDVVSFTGSIETGRKVGMAAADGVKKAIMELGGNSPVLVFADADLAAALDAIAAGGLYNAGQECMSATRLIVADSILEDVVAGLVQRCQTAVVGVEFDRPAVTGDGQDRRAARHGEDRARRVAGWRWRRLLLPANDHRRRRTTRRDRRRGDLRTCLHGAGVQRRERCSGQGERHVLRLGVIGLHLERRHGDPGAECTRLRNGVGQQPSRVRRGHARQRFRTLGTRNGERRGRSVGVHPRQARHGRQPLSAIPLVSRHKWP
jgi:acyl-CoA reductase-like NAD-dependent aldehyde dehydrogenase